MLEHAAGRSSHVLFMNVFDKSLSGLLLLLIVVVAVDGRESKQRNVFDEKQNNKFSI